MPRIAISESRFGFGRAAGRIGGWTRAGDDRVIRGGIIAEIETGLATTGPEAADSGALVRIVAEAGTEVPIGDVTGSSDGGA